MTNTVIDTEVKHVKMKKDVYEHLAKTFLNKKEKGKPANKKVLKFVYLGLVTCFVLIFFLGVILARSQVFSRSLSVIQDRTPVEMDYDFSSAGGDKVRSISFNLNGINLSKYNHLSLMIRTEKETTIDSSVKVKIENTQLEKDSEYIIGIDGDWREFKVSFSKFEKIKNWSTVKSLSLVVEEWNVDNKIDKIFFDEVKFISKKES